MNFIDPTGHDVGDSKRLESGFSISGSSNKSSNIKAQNTSSRNTEVKNQAIVDAQIAINYILKKSTYSIWKQGTYFIAEASYAYFYYQNLKMEVHNYKFKNSALEAAIVPATIFDSYRTIQEYSPMPGLASVAATAVLSVLSFIGIDDGKPNVSMSVKEVKERQEQSRGVSTTLAKFNYIMNTNYRYLMFGSEGRSEFMNHISMKKAEIQQTYINPYNNRDENLTYKAAYIEYMDKIYDMNKDFDSYNEMLKYDLQLIDDTVSRIDAQTINNILFR